MKSRIVLAVLFALAAPGLVLAATNRSDPDFVYQANQPPIAGGGACPTPQAIAALPFSDAGTNCDGTNAISNYGGVCNTNLPFPYPGPEAIYQINLGVGNNVAFSAVVAGSTGDLAVFVVGSACGVGTNCVASSQDSIGAGAGPENIAAAAYTPGTYFVYIDSYYAVGNGLSCGNYTLNVTGTLPAELIEFSVE